jgi:hypothetical protein
MNSIEVDAAVTAANNTIIRTEHPGCHRSHVHNVPHCALAPEEEVEENDRQPLLMKSSTSLESIGTMFSSYHHGNDEKIVVTPIDSQYGSITDINNHHNHHNHHITTPSLVPIKTVSNRWYPTRKIIARILTTFVIALIVVLVVNTITTVWETLDDADDMRSLCEWSHHPYDESCPSTQLLLRHSSHHQHHALPPMFSTAGIQMYLHLFDRKFRATLRNVTSSTSWDNHRFLSLINPLSDNTIQSSSSSSSSTSSTTGASGSTNFKNTAPTLVIAGKMTIDGQPCNIGQCNLKTNEWSLSERIQLSLYNSYSGGEVYSLLANHTSTTTTTTTTTTSISTSLLYPSKTSKSSSNNNNAGSSSASTTTTTTKQTGSGELLVVGAFDTTYRNSQVTYCSVGMWDGTQLSKVGEGLCNSALSKGMKITTASLAGPQDVYVAGSFQTRTLIFIHEYIILCYHLCQFNSRDRLPLSWR